jgi:hypothetical protein
MKLSFLLGVAIGYVLGTRAGRERYEDIVKMARRVAGSQTVQSTAGVVQAQIQQLAGQAKGRFSHRSAGVPLAANGHARH